VPTLRLTKHIDAPPEVTFAVAADVARWPETIRGIERIELLTDGPIGAGTRFRETRTMFGRQAVEEITLTAFGPPHSFTLEALSCGARIVSVHRFIPDIAGTLVELTCSTKAESLRARLLAPLGWLLFKVMAKPIDADLEDLRKAAEARAPVDWRAVQLRERRAHEAAP
jgi:hypothetical protein